MARNNQRSSGKSPSDKSGNGGKGGKGSVQQDQGGDTSQQGGASDRATRERDVDSDIETGSSPRSRADSSDSPDAGKT